MDTWLFLHFEDVVPDFNARVTQLSNRSQR